MPLTLKEAVPFLASSYFLLWGMPWSGRPWDEYQEWVTERHDEIASECSRAVAVSSHPPIAEPHSRDIAEEVTRSLVPTTFRARAQAAASLAGLPEKATLTAIGILVAFQGPLATILSFSLILGVIAMEQSRKLANAITFRPGFSLPTTSVVLLVLNLVSIVVAAST